jgi:phosphoribosyl 1,2-cyclic phosphodiesterase
MQAWRPKENLVNSARAYFHREEFLTRLHRRMDNAERSYHRALKQLLQLQSGYPAPAQAKAPTVELPPVEPVPAELEPPPVPILHGSQTIHGFRFGRAAYLTDHSGIPEASMEQLRELDVLFLDALRYKPHPTHSTVDRSIKTVEALAPRRAFFTHICHDLRHARAESLLPPNIRLAYDGLEILVEGA